MTFDGVIHISRMAPVPAAFDQLGFRISLAPLLGIVELACVAVYAIPATAMLDAILLTGYLGGQRLRRSELGQIHSLARFPSLSLFFCGWGCSCVMLGCAR
jgi:hypothetical protein